MRRKTQSRTLLQYETLETRSLLATFAFDGAIGSQEKVTDESGNIQLVEHGTPSSAIGVDAVQDSAYGFDGDDYLEIGDVYETDLDFYLELWVRVEGASGGSVLIQGATGMFDESFTLRVMEGESATTLSFESNRFGDTFAAHGQIDIGDGEWHHVAANVVFHDETGESTLQVFVDGQLDAEVKEEGGILAEPLNWMVAAENRDSIINQFSGVIDNVTIAQGTWDPSFSSSLFRQDESTIAIWRMNGVSGSINKPMPDNGNAIFYAEEVNSPQSANGYDEISNGAYGFNAESYLSIPNATGADYGTSTTIEALIYYQPSDGLQAIYMDSGLGSEHANILFYVNSEGLLGGGRYSGSGWTTASSDEPLTENEWHYVALTIEVGEKLRIYSNGEMTGESANALGGANTPTSTTNGAQIGALNQQGDPTHLWAGSIDEVMLSSVAKSEETILETFEFVSSNRNKGIVFLRNFTHEATDQSLLNLNYEIVDGNASPFQIDFRAQMGETTQSLVTLEISPNALLTNEAISLKGESPQSALTLGEHTLVIDASLLNDLANSLLDADVDSVRTWLIRNDGTPAQGPEFRGGLQLGASSPAVVRTGNGTSDEVALTSSGNQLVATWESCPPFLASGCTNLAAQFENPLNLTVVTGTLNDEIRVDSTIGTPLLLVAGSGNDLLESGAGTDYLNGGEGNDVYSFKGGNIGGNDVIIEAENTGKDTVRFDEMHTGIILDIGSDLEQFFVATNSLKLQYSSSIERVIGSAFDDEIEGNIRSNLLIGAGGDDIIRTESTLLSPDVIFGDSFEFKTGLDDFVSCFEDFDSPECESIVESLLNLTIPVAQFRTTENGNDKIFGGAGTEIIVGGSGDDLIAAGDGGGLIFGDGFTVTADFDLPIKLDLKDVIDTITKINPVLNTALQLFDAVELRGEGIDSITSGNGVDIVFGGDNRDEEFRENIYTGGGFLDVLFGNEGNDNLSSDAKVAVAVGGLGNDDIDLRSSIGTVVFGDTYRFLRGFEFEINFEEANFSLELGIGFVSDGGDPQNKSIDADTIRSPDSLLGNFIVASGGSDSIFSAGTLNLVIADGLDIGGSVGVSIDIGDISDALFSPGSDAPPIFTSSFSDTDGDDIVELGGIGNWVIAGGGDDRLTASGTGFNYLEGERGSDHYTIFLSEFLGHTSIVDEGSATDIDTVDVTGSEFAEYIDVKNNLIVSSIISKPWSLSSIFFSRSAIEVLRIYGGDGNDVIRGSESNDEIYGGQGDDILYGSGGNDKVFGEEGDDYLLGGSGSDFLHGGADNDTIHGGLDVSVDTLIGGDGRDIFFQFYGDIVVDPDDDNSGRPPRGRR